MTDNFPSFYATKFTLGSRAIISQLILLYS